MAAVIAMSILFMAVGMYVTVFVVVARCLEGHCSDPLFLASFWPFLPFVLAGNWIVRRLK